MAILKTSSGLFILCVWLDGEVIPISIPTNDKQYLINAARNLQPDGRF